MLLLGTGHCFRDHVLQVCPEFARFSSAMPRAFVKQLRGFLAGNHPAHGGRRHGRDPGAPAGGDGRGPGCAAGARAAAGTPTRALNPLPAGASTKPGAAPPTRRVVLAWRRSFTRYEAIAALRNAVYACELPGVTRLS
jgi:LysR family hydrogen peroxide-inducible transcriptional activator